MTAPEVETKSDADARAEIELLNSIAGLENSPWEPPCISAAFATTSRGPFTLTMQAWFNLSHVCSPVLRGAFTGTQEELMQALAAFGYEAAEPLKPEEGAVLAEDMHAAVDAGFSTTLKMRQEGNNQDGSEEGFGSCLPLFACLVSQLGLGVSEALHLPVAQAMALIAAHRHNQGWKVAGEPYAMRGAGLEWHGGAAGEDAQNMEPTSEQPAD